MKFFMYVALLVTLGVASKAHAFQAYFDSEGIRYQGEVTATFIKRMQCVNYYGGGMIIQMETKFPSEKLLHVEGSAKVCGWIGPTPHDVGYSVIMPDGKRIQLTVVDPAVEIVKGSLSEENSSEFLESLPLETLNHLNPSCPQSCKEAGCSAGKKCRQVFSWTCNGAYYYCQG